jgi:hypothetical protein
VLGEPRTLERPRLLDVDPLEALVPQALDLGLGALSRRRNHGRAAPGAGPSGQSWSEGDRH